MTEKSARILYIEDDHASRRLVERVLTSRGYEVLVATEGLEGINLAREQKPQLILMDINLPNMDGREITTRLRSLPNFSNVPIVALTANISAGSRELALAAGCTGFMTKPIDVATFPADVERFLQGKQDKLTADERNEHLEKHAQNLVESLEKKVRELRAVNKRLLELDSLKSDFIVLVSHELRTPLTLVSGYSHLLAEQVSNKNGLVQAQSIAGIAEGLQSGVARMQDVINEIISVVRISSGTLDLSLGPVRLTKVVNDVQKTYGDICRKRNLTLDIGDFSELPLIQGDGRRIQSAVEHVVGNAVKYTPDGGRISLSGHYVLDKAVDIIVQDTGIGIPLEEQRHIFEQFYTLGAIQHHSTSKSAFQGGGLGLGLAIAKGIVEAHNGRIWVESERRDPQALPGSTFHILLPLSPSDEVPDL
ncbi:MAG: hybrid sensor histidine kinase/response regulator [Chloroflexi bacterium]|jgi:signal transduction histidine kinase|nr:hybrid sensor histidine kinase/response regulator [Chloroflexota bacterium]MBK6708939.1 hybrid sensor histidine kinase/response regulator [Chloroflexota bacterium]MBK7175896.1 hybrid sensor histidine kinase/response regulator [Chloroflexota bacterium]MBK7914719.1 hybrid sensor histidine kinase/response regulator [Chloroflexota bacterium]MBK8934451.1 hybrid sensor histidine kinase/response regulator [Chloroflexota bacterium]